MPIEINCKESDIEDILCEHADKMLGVKFLKRQYRTPVGVIDILAKSNVIKDCFYVIEIKNTTLNPDAYTQVLRYSNWMNKEESKDGRRYFIPVLVGRFLNENLCHLCEYFSDDDYYGRHNIRDVFYRCYDFNPISGVSFEYYSIAQKNCGSMYSSLYDHFCSIEEDLDYAKYQISKLLSGGAL